MGLTPEQLEGARWSSAVICPRRCVYEANEVEPSDDLPQALIDIFWRSTVLGNAYQTKYVAENPGWVAEVEAPWGTDPALGGPIGIGHIDLGNEAASKGIEVKVLAAKIPKHAYLQITGYMRFKNWDYGEIHSIDPVNGKVTVTPVDLSHFAEEADAILRTVEESLKLQTLPERVCNNPGSWQARGCGFRTKCFLGWVSDELELDDPEAPVESVAEQSLQSLVSVNQEIRDARRHLQSLEGIRDHLREEVKDLPRGRWVKFGDGMEVRITPVAGSASLSVSRMREAGWDVPPELQEFVSEGRGHERWTFKQH